MQEDQEDPALRLRQARADAQRGIEDLEKASEALRPYGITSDGVRTTRPAKNISMRLNGALSKRDMK